MINLFICLTPSTEKPINNVKHAISHGTARWLMSVFTMWAEQSECNGKTLSWSRHTCQTNTSSLARRGQTSFYTPLFFPLELTAVRGGSPGLQSQWMIHLIMEADWRNTCVMICWKTWLGQDWLQLCCKSCTTLCTCTIYTVYLTV